MSTKTVSFKASEDHVERIDKIVEEKGYTSRGEYLRELLRNNIEPELTSETIERIKESRRQLSSGEGKELEDL
jgi:Arc/MetJ-type ribon-helix-helix transcriptional regulator